MNVIVTFMYFMIGFLQNSDYRPPFKNLLQDLEKIQESGDYFEG